MLDDVIICPPLVGSFYLRRRRRHRKNRKRSGGKVWAVGIHICRRVQDMADEAICSNKGLYSIIPEKEVTLRSKDMNMGNSR